MGDNQAIRPASVVAVAVGVAVGLAIGCSPLTAEGTRVVVVPVEAVGALADCERVGHVCAESILGGVLSYFGCRQSIALLRNAAAKKNGTHIVVTSLTCGVFGGSDGEGEIYRCPAIADQPNMMPSWPQLEAATSAKLR